MIAAFSPEAYLYCCMLNCCYSPPTYHPLLFFNRTTTAGFPVISHNALYTILQSCFIYMIHFGRRVLSQAQDWLFSVNKVHQFACSCQPTAVFCHYLRLFTPSAINVTRKVHLLIMSFTYCHDCHYFAKITSCNALLALVFLSALTPCTINLLLTW